VLTCLLSDVNIYLFDVDIKLRKVLLIQQHLTTYLNHSEFSQYPLL